MTTTLLTDILIKIIMYIPTTFVDLNALRMWTRTAYRYIVEINAPIPVNPLHEK